METLALLERLGCILSYDDEESENDDRTVLPQSLRFNYIADVERLRIYGFIPMMVNTHGDICIHEDSIDVNFRRRIRIHDCNRTITTSSYCMKCTLLYVNTYKQEIKIAISDDLTLKNIRDNNDRFQKNIDDDDGIQIKINNNDDLSQKNILENDDLSQKNILENNDQVRMKINNNDRSQNTSIMENNDRSQNIMENNDLSQKNINNPKRSGLLLPNFVLQEISMEATNHCVERYSGFRVPLRYNFSR